MAIAATAFSQPSLLGDQEERPRLRVLGPPEPSTLEWLLHAAGCVACTNARAALNELYAAGWDPDRLMPVACPRGLRLMALEDIELMLGPDGGLDREWAASAAVRLREQADELRGVEYANRHAGVAWVGLTRYIEAIRPGH